MHGLAEPAPSGEQGDKALSTARTPRPVARAYGSATLGSVRSTYRRNVHRTPDIRMTPGALAVDGRVARYAVSDNEDAFGPMGPGSPPIWAVNIHGYFAGAGMYFRESARLAQVTGWRVVNPSLPGFGGSDPLRWDEISMPALADHVDAVLRHVEAGPVVLLGHSMGGAVAVQYAHDRPTRTLGIIYRDGIATPAWKDRRGLLPALFAPFLPDLAPMADRAAAVAMDLPDLLIGRMLSTVRSVLPDVRRNIRTLGRTVPVGSMLLAVDQRAEVRGLAEQNVPMLAEWGCFDRVANSATAQEFAEVAGVKVQWLPGGHSWMLARPQAQADVLKYLESGRAFADQVEDRWRLLAARDRTLRALS